MPKHIANRPKDNAVYEQLDEIEIPDDCLDNYIKDQKIQVKYKDDNGIEQLLALCLILITFYLIYDTALIDFFNLQYQ